jgi:polyisoprenoid-binding protein YceI
MDMKRLCASLALAVVAACSTERPSTTTTTQTAGGEVANSVSGAVPAVRLVVDTAGAEVRYRVRERLVGKELDNDAVGVTRSISGQIALAADGSVIPEESKITIDVTGLKSDQDRRDGYVQRRLLETSQYPTVVFAPTAIRAGPTTIPTSGNGTFSIVGNLTIRGVTRPATWTVNARYLPMVVTGTAATAFTFADFSIAQPRVPILLSVSDTIRLEYDFNLAVKK